MGRFRVSANVMRNAKIFFAVVLALSTFAVAQPAPKPLPDAPTVLQQLQTNQKELEQLRRNYVCVEDEQEYDLNKDGSTKKVEKRQYEFYFVDGFPIKKLLSKEGAPLSDSEKRKENERVAKAEQRAHERRAKLDRGEQEKNSITVSTFLRASRFQNMRREQYDGREVLAFDFVPNPEFDPHGLSESVAAKLAGSLWVDEDARQVVRLEARLTKSQSAGFGLASLKEGTNIVLEQQKINDEIWLPKMTDANVGLRVLFSGQKKRVVEQYSNYRKFKTDTKIVGVEEVK